jgi:hypothetical protein
MDSGDFKIMIPNYLNPDAPPGENLTLVFTIEEMERARRRGVSSFKHVSRVSQ